MCVLCDDKGYYIAKYPDNGELDSGWVKCECKVKYDEKSMMLGDRMDFGDAIRYLKLGRRVTRSGWNGRDMYLELQVPDEISKMTLPYIYMYTAQKDLVPWLASQTDMLSEDWEIVHKI